MVVNCRLILSLLVEISKILYIIKNNSFLHGLAFHLPPEQQAKLSELL